MVSTAGVPSPLRGIFSSIDAYVRVDFGGVHVESAVLPLYTDAKCSLSGEVNDELWVPVLVPCMTNTVRVSVWDEDLKGVMKKLGSDSFGSSFDELVAYTRAFRFDELDQVQYSIHTRHTIRTIRTLIR
jgi:hypothetical protein